MLDVADKLGSVLSALVGLLGVALTAYGLRLQHRDRAVSPPEPPPASQDSAEDSPPGLHIPSPGERVPDSRYLPSPPRSPSAPQTPSGAQPGQVCGGAGEPLPDGPASWWRRSVPVLVLGLALVGVALGLAVLTAVV